MTKADLMANFDEVVSDPRLGREVVEAHLAASVREPSLLLGEYVCLASGGSSGSEASSSRPSPSTRTSWHR